MDYTKVGYREANMLETIPAQAALDDAIASVQGTVDEKGAKIDTLSTNRAGPR